jgi:hypothetical protein
VVRLTSVRFHLTISICTIYYIYTFKHNVTSNKNFLHIKRAGAFYFDCKRQYYKIFENFTRTGFVKVYSALLHNLKPQQLRPHCIFCNVRVNEWPLHFKISSLQTNIFSPNDNSTLTSRMLNANFFVNLITIIEL